MASIPPKPQAANIASTTAPATLAANIDAYLRTKNSPMAGEGANIVAVAQQYNLDPRLLVALTGAETGFGTHITAGTFNVGNTLYNHHNSPFPSYRAAFNSMGKSLTNIQHGYNLASTSAFYGTYCKPHCGRGLLALNRFMAEQGASVTSLHFPIGTGTHR